MFDFRLVQTILIDRAVQRADISYSELFHALGKPFGRPKVKQLCKLLGELDRKGLECNEAPLAVFVVRAIDRLPGEGWWESRTHYNGPRTGHGAMRYVKRLQRKSSRYWQRALYSSIEADAPTPSRKAGRTSDAKKNDPV